MQKTDKVVKREKCFRWSRYLIFSPKSCIFIIVRCYNCANLLQLQDFEFTIIYTMSCIIVGEGSLDKFFKLQGIVEYIFTMNSLAFEVCALWLEINTYYLLNFQYNFLSTLQLFFFISEHSPTWIEIKIHSSVKFI